MQPTETKETIGNKENAKMLFLRHFVSVLFLEKDICLYINWFSKGYKTIV